MSIKKTIKNITGAAAFTALSFLPARGQDFFYKKFEYPINDKKYEITLLSEGDIKDVKSIDEAKKRVLDHSINAFLLLGSHSDSEIGDISSIAKKFYGLNKNIIAQTEPLIVKIGSFEDYRVLASTTSNYTDNFEKMLPYAGAKIPSSSSYISRLEEDRRKKKIPETEEEMKKLIEEAQNDGEAKDSFDVVLFPSSPSQETIAHELSHVIFGDVKSKGLLRKIDEINDSVLSGKRKDESYFVTKFNFPTYYAKQTAENAYNWVEDRVKDIENSVVLIRGLSPSGIEKIKKTFSEEIELYNSKIKEVGDNFSKIKSAGNELGFPSENIIHSSEKAITDFMNEKKREVEIKKSAVNLYASTREKTFDLYRKWLNELSIELQNEEDAAEIITYEFTGRKDGYKDPSSAFEEKRSEISTFLKNIPKGN